MEPIIDAIRQIDLDLPLAQYTSNKKDVVPKFIKCHSDVQASILEFAASFVGNVGPVKLNCNERHRVLHS
eukprot:3654902-Amphidinium_carterae.1